MAFYLLNGLMMSKNSDFQIGVGIGFGLIGGLVGFIIDIWAAVFAGCVIFGLVLLMGNGAQQVIGYLPAWAAISAGTAYACFSLACVRTAFDPELQSFLRLLVLASIAFLVVLSLTLGGSQIIQPMESDMGAGNVALSKMTRMIPVIFIWSSWAFAMFSGLISIGALFEQHKAKRDEQ